MPVGINSLELNSFFKLPSLLTGKSIQPAFRFYVTFFDDPWGESRTSPDNPGPMPIIRAYHVQDITIPSYKFNKETMMYGQVPRSFPVLDFKGFNLQITFEEDEMGTIAYFINWMQRNIITPEGYYRAPAKSNIGHIVVEVQDKQGFPVVYYAFNDCFFQEASDPTYSYASNETIKYTVTFAVNRMATMFTKASVMSALASAALAKGSTDVVGKMLTNL